MENQKILAKLLAVSSNIKYLQKDKQNSFQKYKYLSEAKIKEVIKENLTKNGVVFTFSSDKISEYEISSTSNGVKQFVTKVEGKYRFYDVETGEYIENNWVGTGSDTGDKGVYKAITGGIKYIFNTTFLIPTGDDPEVDDNEEEQTDKPKAKPTIVDMYHTKLAETAPDTKQVEQPEKAKTKVNNTVNTTQTVEEPKRKFSDEQKAAIKKVKELFHIKFDQDLNKYVSYWAKKTNKKYSSQKDLTPDNITEFCEFTLKFGSDVVPF